MRAPKVFSLENIRSFKILHTFAMSIRPRSSPSRDSKVYVTIFGRTRLFLFICLNKSIARSMFFNLPTLHGGASVNGSQSRFLIVPKVTSQHAYSYPCMGNQSLSHHVRTPPFHSFHHPIAYPPLFSAPSLINVCKTSSGNIHLQANSKTFVAISMSPSYTNHEAEWLRSRQGLASLLHSSSLRDASSPTHSVYTIHEESHSKYIGLVSRSTS